jgi:hypothetical protein
MKFLHKRSLLFFGLLCAIVAPAMADPALLLTSATAKPGDRVELSLSLNKDVYDLCGLMLTFNYGDVTPASASPLGFVNPGSSRLSSMFSGSLYAAAGIPDPNTGLPLPQMQRIAIVHAESIDGPASVLTVPFDVPNDAPNGAAYAIRVSAVTNDSFGVKFDTNPATGTITVNNPNAGVLGDVNGNGRIEVTDATLILRAAVGLGKLDASQSSRADANQNGKIDVGDAVNVLRWAIGLK